MRVFYGVDVIGTKTCLRSVKGRRVSCPPFPSFLASCLWISRGYTLRLPRDTLRQSTKLAGSSSRDAGKLGATLSPCLSFSLLVTILILFSFARDDRLLRIVRFDLRRASATPCSPFPRVHPMSSISHKRRAYLTKIPESKSDKAYVTDTIAINSDKSYMCDVDRWKQHFTQM